MRRVVFTLGAVLAAAGIGALAAGLAGGDPPPAPLRIDPDRDFAPLPVERVAAAGAAARRARGGSGGEQLEFFQTQPLEIPPQEEEGATLTCPKGYRAAGGYFRTGRKGTFLGLTAPQISVRPAEPSPEDQPPSKRNWLIAIFNSTAEADQAVLGVSCLKKR